MHTPPRILIVDDNETNRDILRTRLGQQILRHPIIIYFDLFVIISATNTMKTLMR